MTRDPNDISISTILEARPIRFRILQLRFMGRMTYREICRETGLSRKAVRIHIDAAMQQLRANGGYDFDLDQKYSD